MSFRLLITVSEGAIYIHVYTHLGSIGSIHLASQPSGLSSLCNTSYESKLSLREKESFPLCKDHGIIVQIKLAVSTTLLCANT